MYILHAYIYCSLFVCVCVCCMCLYANFFINFLVSTERTERVDREGRGEIK